MEEKRLPDEKTADERVIVFEEETETEEEQEEESEEKEEREEFGGKKESFKESIKISKEEPEEEFKISGIRIWQILTAVFALLLIISIFTNGFRFGGAPTGAAGAAVEEQKETEPTPTAPTEVQRENVGVDDDAQKGPSNAKVTIIEFSDYQCPYCAKAEPTLKQIFDTYKNDVRLVYRDFPLNFHQYAQKAAEASECAHEQGKFWEYHDILFNNQQALDVSSLKKYASDLKLDTAKFNGCLDSGKYEAEVKKDMQDGLNANVRGTPAFFINGRLISGSQPFENFKTVIDEELK